MSPLSKDVMCKRCKAILPREWAVIRGGNAYCKSCWKIIEEERAGIRKSPEKIRQERIETIKRIFFKKEVLQTIYLLHALLLIVLFILRKEKIIDNIELAVSLFILNIPDFIYFSIIMFDSSKELRKSVKYHFTPGIVSFFRGEYSQAREARRNLYTVIFFTLIIISIEYMLINLLKHQF